VVARRPLPRRSGGVDSCAMGSLLLGRPYPDGRPATGRARRPRTAVAPMRVLSMFHSCALRGRLRARAASPKGPATGGTTPSSLPRNKAVLDRHHRDPLFEEGRDPRPVLLQPSPPPPWMMKTSGVAWFESPIEVEDLLGVSRRAHRPRVGGGICGRGVAGAGVAVSSRPRPWAGPQDGAVSDHGGDGRGDERAMRS